MKKMALKYVIESAYDVFFKNMESEEEQLIADLTFYAQKVGGFTEKEILDICMKRKEG